MGSNVQAVEVTQAEGAGRSREEVHKHPAFAQIGAHRISGDTVLYGSDFQHNGFIRIHVRRSELHRGLSSDWPYAREELIAVDLSEAQWATFVSSMNVGEGVQCTLSRLPGEDVPGLPEPTARHKQFAGELVRTQAEAVAALDELRAAVKESGLSAKKAQALERLAERAAMMIGSNSRFVAQRFGEHMADVTEQAKCEVNAYAMRAMLGLQERGLALEGPDPAAPPIVIEFNEQKEG